MSSTTETTSHQTAHRSTAAGAPRDPRDPTEAGDEISGAADTEIWTEIDRRGIETGNETGTEGSARETGAETGMMIATGIADEVRKENIAGHQKDVKTENRDQEEEATVAMTEAKEK